jgi:hypothetical protein
MFSPAVIYSALGAVIASFMIGVFSGWKFEHNRFIEFKSQVAIVSAKQEAKIESIQKQQVLVTKGIENEYEAKIANIRNYYKSTSLWNNSNSSKVPKFSTATSQADVISSYNLLASSCAETTQQLVSLQDWLNEQIGIK